MGNKIALVDIGDTQITGVVAYKDVNGAFIKVKESRLDYTGLSNGKYNDNADFTATLGGVLMDMQTVFPNKNNAKNTLYISIPNSCCCIRSDEAHFDFPRAIRVGTKHINNMTDSIDDSVPDGTTFVSKEVVYYTATEYEPCIDIRGANTDNVTAFYSVVSASNEFFSAIPVSVIHKYGFNDIVFVPLPSAEVFLMPENIRDGGCTLIRNDFLNTSIVHILGDCATYISNFNMGKGHIINELMDSFEIEYGTAVKLLSVCNCTVDATGDENYIVNGKSFPAQIVNKLVKKQLSNTGRELSKEGVATVIFSSGEELDKIFGAKNIISNAIGVGIDTVVDPLSHDSKHPDTTINALLSYIVRKQGGDAF
jgi:cell division ATPase FtsA